MILETLIRTYGYWAVLVGTFLEGETILVLGGLSAHLGYLKLSWVIAAAFCGTLAGDQLYFFLGRRHGRSWLERRPSWRARVAKVTALLERHQTWLTLGFRFLYGLRTVTPFAIGLSGVSAVRFALLNAIGALAWATAIAVLGYAFGRAVEAVIGEVKRYEVEIMGLVIMGGAAAWLLAWRRQRRR